MRKRKARREIPTADYHHPKTFKMCMLERAEVDPGGIIDVYLLEDGHGIPRHVGAMTVEDACGLDGNGCCIEEALREDFGGGHFQLRVSDRSGRVLTSYHFRLEGPEGGSRWSPKKDRESDIIEETMEKIFMRNTELLKTIIEKAL